MGQTHPNDRGALLEDVTWLAGEVERLRAPCPICAKNGARLRKMWAEEKCPPLTVGDSDEQS
jgi:hypothetical protein